MGVVCQILINRPKGGFFKPGQTVTGTVKYSLDKPTEYKAVTLSFLGVGRCHWTEKDSKNESTSYSGKEEYTTVHIDLLNKKAETAILDTGTYEYPFEFFLPEDIPSSFKNFHSCCTINYRILLKFVKPKVLSFNKEFFTDIPVRGFIEPAIERPVVFGLEKTLMKLFSTEKPVINLKAEIVRTCLLPEEQAHLSLVVTNDSDIRPIVKTYLYCYTVYTADCGHKNTVMEKVKDCSSDKAEIPARGVANLSQTIPTNPDLYTINCKVMKKEYKLKVTVKLPMPHVNAFVEIPISIGERKALLCEELEDKASKESLEGEDEPPSYWQVMSEGVKKN